MFTPFHTANKELYQIEFLGIADNLIEEKKCYHLKVTAKEQSPDLINGDYFIDVNTFNFVRINFVPAKLVKKMMFKLYEMDMTIRYAEADNGFSFPKQFNINGRGKAALFFGVKFNVVEYYKNPIFNSDLEEKYFEVKNGN